MIFTVLSWLCYIFAAIDFFGFYIFDLDMTGVSWSPIVAGVLGYVFSLIGNAVSKSETGE